ncbi:MAG: peptidylprolyl isomerase, partial [Candidatus Krumholzibacteriia bacterium]
EGGMRLLHIVAADTQAVRLVRQDLARGIDFSVVATRYSVGPTAARGGDLGWVMPDEMVEPLRSAIRKLKAGEVSQATESRGTWHFFKRLP